MNAAAERTAINSILVWGGVHGRPPQGEGGIGVPLVKSLHDHPVRNKSGFVTARIGNPEAVRRGVRYVDKNLILCYRPELYPRHPDIYEDAIGHNNIITSAKYDLVLDFHQQTAGNELDVAYVGPRVYAHTLGFLADAGITTLFVNDTNLQRTTPQAVLVDLAPNSPRENVAYWRTQLLHTLDHGLASPLIDEFSFYTLTDLTDDEHDILRLRGRTFSPLREELPNVSALLGVERTIYSAYGTANEVVTPLLADEIELKKGQCLYYEMPNLRSLAS